MKLQLAFYFALLQCVAHGQTVGVTQYDAGTYEGYSIVHPLTFDTTYLIDNCGHVIQKWESAYSNGPFAEITTDGHLMRNSVDPNATNFTAGGATGIIQELDWNGNLLWQHTISDSNVRLHHDMELLPNGNVLVIAWERKDAFESIAAGRIPGTMVNNELWPTVIYELMPILPSGATVVWEWHAWDHLVQDNDPGSDNYGSIQNNFRRIDINKGNINNVADWAHVNAIDYNAGLDHIILSSPTFNEIWMIDHSTTSIEAADSVGGARNMGGDLLWRWGNPQSYNSGTGADQELFFQHDCQWVEAGTRFPDHISIYDNRDSINGQLRSKVKICSAAFDTLANVYPMSGGVFLPLAPDYTYDLVDTLFSPRVSGVQVLANDNLLIASGSNGQVIEIDSNDTVLWQYFLPIDASGAIVSQGTNLGITKDIFRMKRYDVDYEGFAGVSMTPGPQIELNPLACTTTIGVQELSTSEIIVYPNPTSGMFTVGGLKPNLEVLITDLVGRIVYQSTPTNVEQLINGSLWNKGLYYIRQSNRIETILID